MLQPTINDSTTIPGDRTGTVQANRYRVVCQLGDEHPPQKETDNAD